MLCNSEMSTIQQKKVVWYDALKELNAVIMSSLPFSSSFSPKNISREQASTDAAFETAVGNNSKKTAFGVIALYERNVMLPRFIVCNRIPFKIFDSAASNPLPSSLRIKSTRSEEHLSADLSLFPDHLFIPSLDLM